MKLIFLGKQASGKGTIAAIMSERFGFCHVSTGDLLRARVNKGDELGKTLAPLVETGALVPDHLVLNVVTDHLSEPICNNGYIIDGFPRNLSQAKLFDKAHQVDKVIVLHISDELVMHRIEGRRQCKQCNAVYNIHPDCHTNPKKAGVCDKCGGDLYKRKDDEPVTIKNRLAIYYKETHPVIEHYRKNGLVIKIDSSTNPEAITQSLVSALGLRSK